MHMFINAPANPTLKLHSAGFEFYAQGLVRKFPTIDMPCCIATMHVKTNQKFRSKDIVNNYHL